MLLKFHFSALLYMLAVIALATACGVSKVDGIYRLTNEQFTKKAAKHNRVILDVRTPEEFATGHIKGALLMNYLDTLNFSQQISALDPKKNYLLYCRSGRRSMHAATLMKSKGFKHVSDLKEGITGWEGATISGNQ